MSTGVQDRAPADAIPAERTERRPVLLLSFDIMFDDQAVAEAIDFADRKSTRLNSSH